MSAHCDAEINQIVTAEYKLICQTGDVYRDASCIFYSNLAQGRLNCHHATDSAVLCITDNGVDPDDTYYGHSTTTCCHDGYTGNWSNDGRVRHLISTS